MINKSPLLLHRQHQRAFEANKFVYPVLSRRSKGLSVGVNLNPDKICNFDCIYCQVDRRSEAVTKFVETDRLFSELEALLSQIEDGSIYEVERFQSVPAPLRRLNDIAFSGDGEPTTFKNFDQIVERTAELRDAHGLTDVKLVVITNASMFHRPYVQKALDFLDRHNGEIWAKLDAGTRDYYKLIERTPIPFARILENITEAAKKRPLVIQSIFMNVEGVPPEESEIDAYCDRLNEVLDAGGRIKLVQVYTVARRPAEAYVTALADEQVDAIAQKVRERTGLTAEAYYG